MRGRKGEPGTHCSRMRTIFQDFLEIVFSPYISVNGDATKSRFSKFCLYTGYIADIRSSAVICFDEVCATLWHRIHVERSER